MQFCLLSQHLNNILDIRQIVNECATSNTRIQLHVCSKPIYIPIFRPRPFALIQSMNDVLVIIPFLQSTFDMDILYMFQKEFMISMRKLHNNDTANTVWNNLIELAINNMLCFPVSFSWQATLIGTSLSFFNRKQQIEKTIMIYIYIHFLHYSLTRIFFSDVAHRQE